MHDGKQPSLPPLQTIAPQARVINDIVTCEELLINRITARTPFIKTTDMQFILATLNQAKRQLKKEDK